MIFFIEYRKALGRTKKTLVKLLDARFGKISIKRYLELTIGGKYYLSPLLPMKDAFIRVARYTCLCELKLTI